MNSRLNTIVSLTIGSLLSISLTSCYDESLHGDESSASISFNVEVASGTDAVTRTGINRQSFAKSMIRMECPASGDSLFLHASVSDFKESSSGMGSRSNTVTSQSGMYNSFYVSAYKYDDAWDNGHLNETPNYFQSQVAQKSGDIYTLNPTRYWPNSGKVRFLAHAPVEDECFTFYPKDDADRGPRVHINISDDITKQNDLLVSYSSEINAASTAATTPMNFKHALTGIRFVCDKKMISGIISNITIKGVRYEGDFFYNMESADQASSSDLSLDANYNAWELYDKVFSLDINYTVTGEEDAEITGDETMFLMFPQSLPDGAVIEITLQHTDSNGNPTGATEQLTGSISGREWPAGKIVTYRISTSSQQLNVDEPATFNYLGSVYDSTSDSMLQYNPITVASFAGDKNMKWQVEYRDEGSDTWSTTSSWLSIDPTWSWQDEAEQSVRFVAKSNYNSVDIDANLKKASSKGTNASPYNLSSSTGAASVENTANCYMVDAPGYYMLPLVYGNAIKDSKTNQGAYIYNGASGSDILAKFENHLGAAISAPYISDNAGCVPSKAGIVWQDVQNLVQNVEYVASAYGGKGGIKFYVSPSSIAQGNALLSISDANSVMWSWHIWVTDFSGFDNEVDITNQDGQQFTLMPVNLGWCSNGAKLRYYPRRTCTVKFTPTEGDLSLSQEITFVQESHTSIPFGNNPYYQWGRKDPFVGTNIAWGNKERWDGTGKYYGTGSENNPPRLYNDLVEDTSETRLTTKQCLDLLIKNPDKWHNPPARKGGSSYISENEIYTNLWGDNTLTDSKTVYDPCPPGYQVNYYYTYTGLLDSGYDWASDKGIEFVKETASDWDTTNLAEFYTDKSKLYSITFPVCGYRDWNDKAEVTDFTVRGFVWMRGCYSNLESYMFRYAAHVAGQANVAPVTMFYATDGLPIRPAISE